MRTENQVRAFAGGFIIVSLLLAHFYSSQWIYFTAFVGVNLFQSAFSGFCPLEKFLKKLQKK